MKGICHIWSRGRLISPSMPVGDDWYLNLNSQKRPPGRNLGEHRLVRRSGATSRGTVVLVFCLRMRSFPRTEVPTIFTTGYLRRVNVKANPNDEIYSCHLTPKWLFNNSLKLRIGNSTNHCSSKSCLVQSSSISTFTTSNLSFL